MSPIGAIGVNNTTGIKPIFRGETKETKNSEKPEQKKEPFKTHAGLKLGVGMAAFPLIGAACTIGSENKKVSVLLPLAAAGIYAANGAIVDKITNDKYEQFDKETADLSKKEIMKNHPNAELTDNNQVYYKSNNGKKYGALLGAVTTPIIGLMQLSNMNMKTKALVAVPLAIGGAIGGLGLGAITDHFVNKGAKKHADIENLK